jgi:hypothetical protein
MIEIATKALLAASLSMAILSPAVTVPDKATGDASQVRVAATAEPALQG